MGSPARKRSIRRCFDSRSGATWARRSARRAVNRAMSARTRACSARAASRRRWSSRMRLSLLITLARMQIFGSGKNKQSTRFKRNWFSSTARRRFMSATIRSISAPFCRLLLESGDLRLQRRDGPLSGDDDVVKRRLDAGEVLVRQEPAAIPQRCAHVEGKAFLGSPTTRSTTRYSWCASSCSCPVRAARQPSSSSPAWALCRAGCAWWACAKRCAWSAARERRRWGETMTSCSRCTGSA
jgi:hypothetical protein